MAALTDTNIFWAAATGPFDENGLGLMVDEATKEIDKIKRFWVLLPEVPLFDEWQSVEKHMRSRVKTRRTRDLLPRCMCMGSTRY
jgi:hypothetical protein